MTLVTYCWWKKSGDHQLRLVIGSLSHCLQAFIHSKWFLPNFFHQQYLHVPERCWVSSKILSAFPVSKIWSLLVLQGIYIGTFRCLMLLLVVDQSSQHHVVRQSITYPCNGAQSSSVRIPDPLWQVSGGGVGMKKKRSLENEWNLEISPFKAGKPIYKPPMLMFYMKFGVVYIVRHFFWCNILPHPMVVVKFRPNHSVAAHWILEGSPVWSPADVVVFGNNHQWSPRNQMEIIELNHRIRNNYHGVNLSLHSGKAFNSDWIGEFRRLPHLENSLFFNSSLIDLWCRPIVTKGDNYCWSKKILHPLRNMWNLVVKNGSFAVSQISETSTTGLCI